MSFFAASADANVRTAKSFLASYRYWLPPASLGLLLALVYLNPFIGDWDGLDYTIASIRGEPSSMALGRALFTFFNHLLFVVGRGVFGVSAEHAYLIFKFAVVAQVPLAIVTCWIFARDLTGSIHSATVAALLVTFSPILVIYGGQVMTDVPSVFLSTAALAVYLRGVQTKRVGLLIAGAIVLGLAVNLRETAGFYLPWLVFAPFVGRWRFDRRTVTTIVACVALFFFVAFGVFALWFATHAGYRATWHVWLDSTRSEAARHPLQLGNLKPFFIYLFLASPLVLIALPIAALREFRARRLSPLLL